MSAFFDATDELTTTSDIIQGNSNFSWNMWVRINTLPTDTTGYISICVKYDAGFLEYIELFAWNDAGQLKFQLDVNNGSGPVNVSTNVNVDTWYNLALSKNGNTHTLILNGTSVGAAVLNMTGTVFATETLGYDGFSETDFNLRNFREWSSAISTANQLIEAKSSVVVITAALQRNCPLTADGDDISGNGFDFTNTGTTFVADTPYPAVNVDPTNAIDITSLLPYNQAVNANPSGLFAFDLWWKYTVPSGVVALGIYGRSANYAVNRSNVDFWETPGATTGSSVSSEDNYPIVSITLNLGDLHYISATPSSRTANPYDFEIDIEAAPDDSVQTADIFSNDDQPDRPAVILSSITNYEVRKLVALPSGESGDIILNGNFLLGDRYTPNMSLYDLDFNLLATFTGNHGGNHSRGIRANRLTSKFYFVRNGNAMVDAIIDRVSGIAIELTFTLTGAATGISLGSICPNLADTVLYHCSNSSNQPIEAWDIPGNAALPNVVAGVASQNVIDILALADGTFAVLRQGNPNAFLSHYDSSWALINTWDLGVATTGGVPARMTWALDDPNSVWVKLFREDLGDPILSEGRNVKLSDGSTFGDVFHTTLFDGAMTPVIFDGSAAPAVFGWPSSCPFFLIPGVGEGTLMVSKETDPLTTGVDFNINVGNGLSPSVLVLQTGDSHVYDPVPAGDGYTVVEDSYPDFFTTYLVSNDPFNDNLNITVGVGENVSVVVLNQRNSTGSGIFEITPTGSGNPGGTPPKTTDSYRLQNGEIIEVSIPNPYVIIGGVKDI